MMVNEEEVKKRVYDETASLITRLALMNRLTSEELHFLLTLLDHVFITNQLRPLINVLHRWLNSAVGQEMNETIKQVLINTDLIDETQVTTSIQFIEEHLCSNAGEPIAKEDSTDE